MFFIYNIFENKFKSRFAGFYENQKKINFGSAYKNHSPQKTQYNGQSFLLGLIRSLMDH